MGQIQNSGNNFATRFRAAKSEYQSHQYDCKGNRRTPAQIAQRREDIARFRQMLSEGQLRFPGAVATTPRR